MVTFREFKVGDLFETKSYRGGSQVLTGGNVPAHLLQAGDTPRISVSSKNNGIIGYYQDVEMASYRVFENAISVSFLGTVFYHPYRASYDMKVHCLRLQDHELRECEALYLISVLRKVVAFCSYGNQLSSTELVDIKLSLPVQVDVHGEALLDDDGNFIPDWDYMESYIHELEESYIHELDVYLKETGLDDYVLTDDEQELIESEPMFKEFKIGDLFTLTGLKQVKSQKNIVESETGIPFVVQSTKNNMVKCHVDRQALLDGGKNVYDGNAIVLGVTLPAVSYQELEFGASQVITARRDDLNPLRGLYIVTAMRKALLPKYSYTNKPGIQKYKDDIIQLPVKPGTDEINYTEDDIDWDYMESYIRTMEKQVITDVVDYKDSIITTAKELIYV